MHAADESLLLPTCHEPFVFFLGTAGEVYASTLNVMRAFEIDRDIFNSGPVAPAPTATTSWSSSAEEAARVAASEH